MVSLKPPQSVQRLSSVIVGTVAVIIIITNIHLATCVTTVASQSGKIEGKREAYSVEGLIEAGKALAPAGGVVRGVVSARSKQLDSQDHKDEDEQNEQQEEIFQ